MNQKLTQTSREIQAAFNQEAPRRLPCFAFQGQALTEGLASIRDYWRREGFHTFVDMTKRLSDVQSFDRTLPDHIVTCLQSPRIQDFDILAMSLAQYAGLRPLWKFLYPELSNSDFEEDHAPIRILRRIFPADVVALWLQVNANARYWRRSNGEYYIPVAEDYAEYTVSEVSMYISINDVTVTLPHDEFLDRWYLGSGGLASNWKRLAYKSGFKLQCKGSALESDAPLLSPPFMLDSEAYLSQLIRGAILPRNYVNILGDWSNEYTANFRLVSSARPD